MTDPHGCVVYKIPRAVLEASRVFLVDRGREGCEGTGLLIGRPQGGAIAITRFFAPEQICIKTPLGIAVDLTEHAHYTLPDELAPGERFYAQIHSHPRHAFHSARDDANAILTHNGAISIVVPDFAKDPIDLRRCAIYRLRHGHGWESLSSDEVEQTFEVVL